MSNQITNPEECRYLSIITISSNYPKIELFSVIYSGIEKQAGMI